jgi:hypothetical protein
MNARDNRENDIAPGTGSAERQPTLFSPHDIASKTVVSPETEVYLARCFGLSVAFFGRAKVMTEILTLMHKHSILSFSELDDGEPTS